MMQTVFVKLETTKEETDLLIDTMRHFNEACNFVAGVAFKERTANKFRLQKETYHKIKESFGLSAQMSIRVIAKVAEALKRDRSTKPFFKPLGAIVYDQRNLSWKGIDRISITTLKGRLKLPIKIGEYRDLNFKMVRGQADLIFRDGKFFVAVVVDAPCESLTIPENIIGVDLGVVNIATDSTGESFSGEQIDRVREKLQRLRSALQVAGTKSAKRHLKKIGNRESRFHRDVNHCISKMIVEKAKDTNSMIAVEDLTGITKSVTVKKSQRARISSWSFYQLRNFIEYKAEIVGIPVVGTYAGYTSRECPSCHTISKSNRPRQDLFSCISCGLSGHPDYIAALNIRNRVAANLPIVTGFIEHNLIVPQLQTLGYKGS